MKMKAALTNMLGYIWQGTIALQAAAIIAAIVQIVLLTRRVSELEYDQSRVRNEMRRRESVSLPTPKHERLLDIFAAVKAAQERGASRAEIIETAVQAYRMRDEHGRET